MTDRSAPDLFRRLPSVDEVLRTEGIGALEAEHGRTCVIEAVRGCLVALRHGIAAGRVDADGLQAALAILPASVDKRAREMLAPSLRRVINASGVVIHTNLGRVPLSRQAIQKLIETSSGYCNLETDLQTGGRGRRDHHAQPLLARLLARQGVDDVETIVVNNNAAAVLLALAGLARGGEVIVSRGELVEIGGSFRIPDIMAESGAVLREVGTTNRTRIGDYERAITDSTRLLLRVHRSNFEIVGFTEQPERAELVELGRRRGIPVMEDLGSGAVVDIGAFGVPGEDGLCDALNAGVSVVTCSGDKLLGGPQAGLISGRPELVGRLRSHPLFRALRVDKMRYAALEGTLSSYLRESHEDIPLLRMLAVPPEDIERRCRALVARITGATAEVLPVRTMIGGGAAPGKSLPSFAVAFAAPMMSAEDLALGLRRRPVPIVARIEGGHVLLDLRTVDGADDCYLAQSVIALTACGIGGEDDG